MRRGLARLAECEQAAALSQQCLGLLPQHLELLPPPGGVGEQARCFGVLAVVLGEQCPGGDHRMLLKWVPGLEGADQLRRQLGCACGERSPHCLPQVRGVGRRPSGVGVVELG